MRSLKEHGSENLAEYIRRFEAFEIMVRDTFVTHTQCRCRLTHEGRIDCLARTERKPESSRRNRAGYRGKVQKTRSFCRRSAG